MGWCGEGVGGGKRASRGRARDEFADTHVHAEARVAIASQNNANNVAALSFLIYRSHAGRCRLRASAVTEDRDDSCDRTSISRGPGRIDSEERSSNVQD